MFEVFVFHEQLIIIFIVSCPGMNHMDSFCSLVGLAPYAFKNGAHFLCEMGGASTCMYANIPGCGGLSNSFDHLFGVLKSWLIPQIGISRL